MLWVAPQQLALSWRAAVATLTLTYDEYEALGEVKLPRFEVQPKNQKQMEEGGPQWCRVVPISRVSIEE